ncbi:hypothetical protein [Streptomyces sp. NPDC126514]|uniref:hypothetical protein n=1 Tax=Streptomyces sp. NPDC126514 TaxID=3155210 RepID=UPI00332A9774
MLVDHGLRNEKKGCKEADFAALLDAAHQQLGGPIVLVWDNATSTRTPPCASCSGCEASG